MSCMVFLSSCSLLNPHFSRYPFFHSYIDAVYVEKSERKAMTSTSDVECENGNKNVKKICKIVCVMNIAEIA